MYHVVRIRNTNIYADRKSRVRGSLTDWIKNTTTQNGYTRLFFVQVPFPTVYAVSVCIRLTLWHDEAEPAGVTVHVVSMKLNWGRGIDMAIVTSLDLKVDGAGWCPDREDQVRECGQLAQWLLNAE